MQLTDPPHRQKEDRAVAELYASVILCTYNRAQLLERTLHSLSRQTILQEQFEVVVVNDGSQDATADVCDKMHSQIANLKYLSIDANVGLAQARNLGIQASTGDRVLFIDDDCIATENWIAKLSSALDKQPIIAGAVANAKSDCFALCHHIAQFHHFTPGQKPGPKQFIAGANMAFRRSILEELNGFSANGMCAQDMELALRAQSRGYQVFFEPEAVVVHDPDRRTLASILAYSARHAETTVLLRNRYQSLLRTPFVLNSRALILAASPVIALKVTMDVFFGNRNLAKYLWTAPMIYILKLAWCWGAARGLKNRNLQRRSQSQKARGKY